MRTENPLPPRRVLWGVASVCFANLLLEVVLTRIFSTTMFYHFTFLSIALALFGLGASGVYVYVKKDVLTVDRVEADLAQNARRFAFFTVVALAYALANPIETIANYAGGVGAPEFTARMFLQMALLCASVAVPFFFAGMVVALAVLHYRTRIDQVYFYDLTGAGVAAAGAGTLLGIFGGPVLVLVVVVCALVGALLFQTNRRGMWALGAGVALLAFNWWHPIFNIPSIKAVQEKRVMFEKWNAFSRVTVEQVGGNDWDIRIDAAARTGIVTLASVEKRAWKKDVSAAAYGMFEGGAGEALIIGPGGGPDVANALASGAHHVTGVEVNPIIANDVMKGQFAKENGGLYTSPRVTVVVDDGRSFVRRAEIKFDVIQATLVDTWAATAAGAFALTENTLYTVEAFEDYFTHLSDGGVLTMTRYFSGGDPETARLVLLAAGALENLGVPPADARKHIILLRHKAWGTLIAKRTEFTGDELGRIYAGAVASGYEVVISPSAGQKHLIGKMVDAGAWSDFTKSQAQDLTPPTDDRPFFFYFLKPGDLWKIGRNFGGDMKVSNPAVWTLLALGFSVIGMAIAFILVPIFVHGRGALRGGGAGGRVRRGALLGYFAAIGLAFITVEIALLQKFTFFLGHPSYALLVVLFAILFATAIGARTTGLLPPHRAGQVALICGVALGVLCLVYAMVLGPALRAWVGWPLAARIIMSGALVGLCGFLMGGMLPSGVKLASVRDAEIVPWGWGINGATSVIGTVAATVVAIHSGFTVTLAIGAVMYVLAGAGGLLLSRLVGREEDAPAVEEPVKKAA